MKKRHFVILLVCLLCLANIIGTVGAAEQYADDVIVIYYEDGSYLTISTFEVPSRSVNTKYGYREYIYTDSDGVEQWRCVLNATFTYDGTTAKATTASADFTPANSNWEKDTLYTYRSGNTASADLTVIKKFLGITVDTYKYTITLSCDKDGNLS